MLQPLLNRAMIVTDISRDLLSPYSDQGYFQ